MSTEKEDGLHRVATELDAVRALREERIAGLRARVELYGGIRILEEELESERGRTQRLRAALASGGGTIRRLKEELMSAYEALWGTINDVGSRNKVGDRLIDLRASVVAKSDSVFAERAKINGLTEEDRKEIHEFAMTRSDEILREAGVTRCPTPTVAEG